MSQANPTRDDFAALLQESFATHDLAEGYVTKGIITAIEKDVAIVDVGSSVEEQPGVKSPRKIAAMFDALRPRSRQRLAQCA